jgi:hypothetical protein
MGAKIAIRLGWLLLMSPSLAHLVTAADVDPAAPSTVTIRERGVRLDAALRKLREQTGNAVVDLRERFGAEGANPAIDLDLDAVPFLRALDEIATKAGVAVTPFTGDGSLGIVSAGDANAARPPAQYAGPFRVALNRIVLQRDFEAGAATARIALAFGWEPRVRPILLSIKSDRVEATDDRARAVRPQVATESGDVVLHAENPSTEVAVNLAAPERSAASLATLRIRAEATLPADVKTFRFPRLVAEQTIRQGNVSATLRGVEVDEQIWNVRVLLDYHDGGPAFESFRQGLLDNRAWLQKADGAKIEHQGSSSADGRHEFEYLFVDVPGAPGDYQLVYEAPGAIVSVPIDVTFKDVPLP